MGDFQDGYYLFDHDINMLMRGIRGQGVIEGLTITGLSGALQLTISSGSVACPYGGAQYAYDILTGSYVNITPDSTYPLKGLVLASASSLVSASVQYIWGTASSAIPAGLVGKYTREPIPPNIPTNSVVLAEVWVPANAANGAACTIFTYREFSPGISGAYATEA